MFQKIFLIILLFSKYLFIASLSTKSCRLQHETYDCSSLNLTTVPLDLWSKYENGMSLKLSNNPFSCDCNISSFLDKINRDPKVMEKIIDLEYVTCATPKHLALRRITELTKEDVCDPCRGDKLINTCDPVREECVSKNSSYECRCKEGFRRQSDNGECEAFNACRGKNSCSVYAQCINQIGSYKCFCNLGFIGDGKHCKDEDECAGGSHECHKDAVCINEVGTYRCHCKAGYKEKKKGRICVKDDSFQNKNNLIFVGLIVGFVLILVALLTMHCMRRKEMKEEGLLQDCELSDKDSILGDPIEIVSNQQVLTMDSFFDDPLPTMKGLPVSESAWSEWPDYDDSRETSDSD